MADHSSIEWTDATWNPIRGCTLVSAGCQRCYAAALALRFGGLGKPFEGLARKGDDGIPVFTGEMRTVEHLLTLPLKWKEPRRIFVNSMSDAFHVDVPRAFLDRMFAVMALCPQHTFQVLTKRPQIAANYLNDRNVVAERPDARARILDAAERIAIERKSRALDERLRALLGGALGGELPWPLPNVWLGTSVEDNRVRHRIAALRRAPAAVHFLSCEPLIGPLDLAGHGCLDHIDWVIVGGESGRNHRPCDPEWVRDLRYQCQVWRVPFFFKQWGGLTPKSGGRLLDGRTWDEFPAQAVAR